MTGGQRKRGVGEAGVVLTSARHANRTFLAMEFLLAALHGRSRERSDVIGDAVDSGFSFRLVQEAAKRLGVVTDLVRPSGFPATWKLPAGGPSDSNGERNDGVVVARGLLRDGRGHSHETYMVRFLGLRRPRMKSMFPGTPIGGMVEMRSEAAVATERASTVAMGPWGFAKAVASRETEWFRGLGPLR